MFEILCLAHPLGSFGSRHLSDKVHRLSGSKRTLEVFTDGRNVYRGIL